MSGDVRTSWTFRLTVFAITGAVGVSVIYLPQALLTKMADGLGVDAAAASLVATTVQMGYALGIFLLIPLADRVHPRRQVTIQSLLLTGMLLLASVSPDLVALAVTFFAVGVVANMAQILIPVGARLSPPDKRGATTGTMVGAILTGIFAGRIVASIFVDLLGWRLVVALFAVLVLATVPFARRALTAEFPHLSRTKNYGRLLLDTIALVKRSPVLTQAAAMQFFTFGTFILLWTVSVLHLTGEPYGWSVFGAGLFGLVGLAAGAITPFSGRLIDRFGSVRVVGVFLSAMLLAGLVMIGVNAWLVPFALTMFVVTLANQSVQSANQLRALTANPTQSAGANTIFMFVMFLGGSIGAYVGPAAYFAGGMTLVCLVAAAFITIALSIWTFGVLLQRRRATLAAVAQ